MILKNFKLYKNFIKNYEKLLFIKKNKKKIIKLFI